MSAPSLLPPVETSVGKKLNVNFRDFFNHVSDDAQFELSLLDEQGNKLATAAPRTMAMAAPAAVPTFAVQSLSQDASPGALSHNDTQPNAQSATGNEQDLVPINDWLTFNTRSGLLVSNGTLAEKDIGFFKFEVTVKNDQQTVSTSGTLDVQEEVKVSSFWYDYDANNQVIYDAVALTNGRFDISEQGQYIEYNATGQQTLTVTHQGASKFTYNSLGFMTQISQYYDKSNELNFATEHANSAWRFKPSYNGHETVTTTGNFWGAVNEREYNAVGQVTESRQYTAQTRSVIIGGGDHDLRNIEPDGPARQTTNSRTLFSLQSKDVTQFSDDGQVQRVTHYGDNNQREYGINYYFDKAGRVSRKVQTQYNSENSNKADFTHTFTHSYRGDTQYQESEIKGRSNNTDFKSGSTKSTYNAQGQRTAIVFSDEAQGTTEARYFDYNQTGQVIRKQSAEQTSALTGERYNWVDIPDFDDRHLQDQPQVNSQGSSTGHWERRSVKSVGFDAQSAVNNQYVYSNDQYIGEMSAHRTQVASQHFAAQSSTSSTSSSTHLVNQGDTLRSVSVAYYGSEDYWYILASANNLSDGDELKAGQTLEIPHKANNLNHFASFMPQNLAELIGDTTPNVPYAPAPPEAGCNAVASIVMIAVAVVATIYTAGAAAGYLGSATGAFSGGLTVLGGGATATGAAIGSTAAAGMAASAIGGFVGSVASQVVGKAIGAIDSFSLKNALASGLTAGATAGVGNVLGVGSTVAEGTKTIFTKTAQTGMHAGKQVLNNWGSAVIGASSAASSVVANKLVGNRASFRWGDVAASAVASGLSGHTGQIGLDNSNPVSGIVNSGVRYGADKLFGNQASWNFGNVAVDAFGNALGNSIVSGLSSTPKSANTATTSAKHTGNTQSVGTTSGAPVSQGAVDINPENALERWNRLEASGGLDSLSDDAYYSLATAANSIENATRPITSFDRFNRLVNHSNMIRQQLNSDLATKAQSVQRTQSLIANNQAWVDRNTTTMGRVPQGFDLESSLMGSIDWADMSQPLTPGPWREEYVFGSPNTQSDLTRYLGYTSLIIGGLGSVHSTLTGIAATKRGSYGFGLVQNTGWTLADKAPLSTIFDGSFGRGASTPLNGVSNFSFGFGPVDEIKSLTGNISGLMDSSLAQTSGRLLTAAGPMVSGFQAYDYQFNQKNHNWDNPANQADIASNWGKFGVDSTFALASLTGVGAIPAGIYGITDFALQASGYSYTPKFHPTEMGVEKKSWTGLMYQFGDMIEANQRVNPNFKVRESGGF